MTKIKVDCVVVTYNKLSLLKECLDAILNQTKLLNKIFVINNASTDGTQEYLDELQKKRSSIVPINSDRNLGGAGGFNKGLVSFINFSDSDFVWVMDDDTIPDHDALEKLITAKQKVDNKKIGYLSSNVRWIDGKAALMNIPIPSLEWNADADHGLVKVKSASFVSILFSREAIIQVGFPITQFFIWGDDVEFTQRMTKAGFSNYFVPDSFVIHKMKANVGTNIIDETQKSRIKRYYYANRNALYTKRKLEGSKGVLKELAKQVYSYFVIIFKKNAHSSYKLLCSFRGTVSGLFFNPVIEQVDDKNKL
ncbi:glycosyltransferase [Lacticaseibacillus rhamnosus]|uniref:glycosyltransferase family 2 protein n=1 Tax=Lacticaseibacillus TaxID=2759736 RepID=UPI000343A26C|nr:MULTISPECIES: glycosyltransferase family 2 protein [Lacticaseibacillus]EPC85090.1 hypothetical protein Lpp124_12782 [Lacticaseibacillus paracasei subsp. paracasei CNCM I-4649]MCT3191724.1 glycosyltransferase [Lacticaseibacillus rhamnosus]NKF03397.1 glycosyltransferase [Lacticaseibacillus paracasei]